MLTYPSVVLLNYACERGQFSLTIYFVSRREHMYFRAGFVLYPMHTHIIHDAHALLESRDIRKLLFGQNQPS